ncbi:MAG: type II toxin-antitoxin system RelE/ParE family toxin [Acidobacteriaceae bacterium]
MYTESESGRPVIWLGSTRKDVRSFPRPVRRDIGMALYAAQHGELDPAAKPMKGFGGGSMVEVVSDFRGDTWRAVYTVRFADAVYVLHAFQKKSKRGMATPRQELDLIRRRLAEAERLRREKQS